MCFVCENAQSCKKKLFPILDNTYSFGDEEEEFMKICTHCNEWKRDTSSSEKEHRKKGS